MDFQITAMNPDYAQDISKWKYDGDYSFYDHSEAGADGLLDGTHFACLDPQKELIGYYCFGLDARIPTVEDDVYDDQFLDIGLGMRPDLCGKGLGYSFLELGLAYAQRIYATGQFRLSVAAFNERAVKVYRKAGFTILQEVTNSYFKNRFYVMTCIAN